MEKAYEEVLALYRQIGNRTGQAGENDNIGDILVYLGDLEGARRGYEAAFSIYQEVGDKNGEALAENGLVRPRPRILARSRTFERSQNSSAPPQ